MRDAYDIDLLRALRRESPRRSAGRLMPLLFAAGLLAYGIHAAATLGAARAGLDRETALRERVGDLDRRNAEIFPLFERRCAAIRERSARIPWRAVLGSIARAVPEGERIDRIAYDRAAGRLTILWTPAAPARAGRFARALRSDTLLASVFPRLASGEGEERDTLHLSRREER